MTLETYLDNACDTKLTAEALFLHRASLYYRLAAHRGHHRARACKSGLGSPGGCTPGLKLTRLLGVHPGKHS